MNVDVGVMLRGFGSVRHLIDKLHGGAKAGKPKLTRDALTMPRPVRQVGQGQNNSIVGKSRAWHTCVSGGFVFVPVYPHNTRQELSPTSANWKHTMRIVLQRVRRASVTLQETGETRAMGPGLLVFIGIGHTDTPADAESLARKLADLRVFEDKHGKINLSLRETSGTMLIVSQFTLLGDARKGRRPSFVAAAPPDIAIPLYEHFVHAVRAQGIPAQTGEFGADMCVMLENDGPFTLVIDSP